jgi:hypothetical protein
VLSLTGYSTELRDTTAGSRRQRLKPLTGTSQ